MSFSTTPLTLVIRAKFEKERLHFLADAKALFRYLTLEDLLDEESRESAEGRGRLLAASASADSRDDKHRPGRGECDTTAKRVFSVATVRRADGGLNAQDRPVEFHARHFTVTDRGPLLPESPKQRPRHQIEKRQVEFAFLATQLSNELGNMCDEGNLALLEALLEQAVIRINVEVEKKLSVPLLIRPVVLLP